MFHKSMPTAFKPNYVNGEMGLGKLDAKINPKVTAL
jgi:hypothetical protein